MDLNSRWWFTLNEYANATAPRVLSTTKCTASVSIQLQIERKGGRQQTTEFQERKRERMLSKAALFLFFTVFFTSAAAAAAAAACFNGSCQKILFSFWILAQLPPTVHRVCTVAPVLQRERTNPPASEAKLSNLTQLIFKLNVE
ncbi:hypothetical protein ACLOJK_035444 [Asimina triloba]